MDAKGKGFNRSLVEHTNKTNSLLFPFGYNPYLYPYFVMDNFAIWEKK